jgi:hypothetical protein
MQRVPLHALSHARDTQLRCRPTVLRLANRDARCLRNELKNAAALPQNGTKAATLGRS